MAAAAAAAGPGPGSGFEDVPDVAEAEAPEPRRKAHGMLKLYYGLSEGEAAGRPAGPDPLDPTDLNGAHFDPEVYLDKVCSCWGWAGTNPPGDPAPLDAGFGGPGGVYQELRGLPRLAGGAQLEFGVLGADMA